MKLGITSRSKGVSVGKEIQGDAFPTSRAGWNFDQSLQEIIIRRVVGRIISESSHLGSYPKESYEKGTVKNLMLDKETSSWRLA